MKFFFVCLVLISFSMTSCSSDEEEEQTGPNVIGTYTLISSMDICPNPDNSYTVEKVDDKVCVEDVCRMITMVLKIDGSYDYEQFNEWPDTKETELYTESGTYETSANVLTTTSSDGSVVDNFDIINNGEFLDWLVVLTDDRCERYFRLNR